MQHQPPKPSVMRSLLWKDTKSILPLVYAVWVTMLVFNLGAGWFGAEWDTYTVFWILIPNLVAIGSPTMLVGSEEEAGTLQWLRTLPVGWQRIADCKLIVSIVAVVTTWALASMILLLVLQFDPLNRLDALANNLLSLSGIAHAAFFTVLLLLIGFVLAFSIRSALAGLLMLIPTVIAVYLATNSVARWILWGGERLQIDPGTISASRRAVVVGLSLCLLLSLWQLQRMFAKRRLCSPKINKPALGKSLEPPASAFRPPRTFRLRQPSQRAALLWQQTRQIRLPVLALTISALALMTFIQFDSPSARVTAFETLQNIAQSMIFLSVIWIGGLTFYGDSVRRRCTFFAVHGVSPTRVWWTRMLLPTLCCGLLAVFPAFLPYGLDRMKIPWYLMLTGFAIGQLTAQWVTRPALAFLVAPTFVSIAFFYLPAFYSGGYRGYAWTFSLIAPVLLYASWRLTDRWLSGTGPGWRIFALVGFAAVLPAATVYTYRIVTTPALDADWRAKTMAASMDLVKQSPVADDGFRISRNAYFSYQGADIESLNEFASQLEAELKAVDSIGFHVTAGQLTTLLLNTVGTRSYRSNIERFRVSAPIEYQAMARDAVLVLLKWDRMIRERILEHPAEPHLFSLEFGAERAEALAVERLPELGTNEEIAKIVAQLPSAELRYQSRRIALLSEWRSFQADVEGKQYPPQFLDRNVYLFGDRWFEQRRSQRFIDEATRVTLDQIAPEKLTTRGSASWNNRIYLWQQARSPSAYAGVNSVGVLWTRNHEDDISALRARYPLQRTEE